MIAVWSGNSKFYIKGQFLTMLITCIGQYLNKVFPYLILHDQIGRSWYI